MLHSHSTIGSSQKPGASPLLRGTSLNQLVRDFLNELTRVDDVEAVIAQLDMLWAEEPYRSQGSWIREELHDRS